MPKKYRMMLFLILNLLISCTSPRIKKNPEIILDLEDKKVARYLSVEPTCDVVLEKCNRAVQSQKVTIEKQGEVIKQQKEIIEHTEKEVERSHKETTKVAVGGVSLSTILLLLLLL